MSDRITRSPTFKPSAISMAFTEARPKRTGTRSAPLPSASMRNKVPGLPGCANTGRPTNSTSARRSISMVPSTVRENMTLPELGSMLYGAICSSCHGFEKVNNPASPSFASLKSVKERMTKEQVLELLRTGRNQMPSFASLSEIERRAAVAFLFQERSTEKIPAKGSPADRASAMAAASRLTNAGCSSPIARSGPCRVMVYLGDAVATR